MTRFAVQTAADLCIRGDKIRRARVVMARARINYHRFAAFGDNYVAPGHGQANVFRYQKNTFIISGSDRTRRPVAELKRALFAVIDWLTKDAFLSTGVSIKIGVK